MLGVVAAAGWVLPLQAAGHEEPAAQESKAAKAGFWQVRPNDPFTTEEGPIEREEAPAVATRPPIAPQQLAAAPVDADFVFKGEDVGWELRQRVVERRRR